MKEEAYVCTNPDCVIVQRVGKPFDSSEPGDCGMCEKPLTSRTLLEAMKKPSSFAEKVLGIKLYDYQKDWLEWGGSAPAEEEDEDK